MHDFSLGGPISLGEYDGYYLDGRPLHRRHCEDGVYGCRYCNSALRSLTDSELDRLTVRCYETGDLIPTQVSRTQSCDWCEASVPIAYIRGIRPWDEPSVYYEVCCHCIQKYDEEVRRMEEEY